MAKTKTEKTDDKHLLEKLAKLTAALEENAARERALLDEMRDLLAGRRGIGEALKSLYAAWGELWQARYGTTYVFSFPKDATLMKRLVVALGEEEVQRRMAVYLTKQDEFYVRAQHSFAIFHGTVNQHGPQSLAPVRPAGRGPGHGLAPVSDAADEAIQQQIETRRRREEMRQQDMSDADIEAVFDREYEERVQRRSLLPDPRD